MFLPRFDVFCDRLATSFPGSSRYFEEVLSRSRERTLGTRLVEQMHDNMKSIRFNNKVKKLTVAHCTLHLTDT